MKITPGNGFVTLTGGKATWLLRNYVPGVNSISGIYNGDGNFATSTSATVAQTVTKVAIAPSVTLSPSGTVTFGVPLTITVAFTVAPIQRVPSGTVTVTQLDGNGSGSKTLAAGEAVFATTAGANPSGAYAIDYGGDAFYLPSSGTAAKITLKRGTSAVLVSAQGLPALEGDTFTLLAEVVGPDVDKGTVTIADGGDVVATGVQVKGNLMSKAVKAGGAGKHTYRVTFSGTANVDGSSNTLDGVIRLRPAAAGRGDAGGKSPAGATTTAATTTTAVPGGAARPAVTTPRPGTTPRSGTTTGATAAGARKPPAKQPTKKPTAKPKKP